MIPYERRKKILNALGCNDIIYVKDLVEELTGCSVSTIRRDLKRLFDEGQVILLRGGAVKLSVGSFDTPLNTRSGLNSKKKDMIGRKAAELVNDGEVIYIDTGTTTLKMLKYLRNKKITVVTSNFEILKNLKGIRFTCIMLGGEVLESTASVVGPITEEILDKMFFDKAFLGASGVDIACGINTPDVREAKKKQIIKANSKETYVLVDGSKIPKRTFYKVFNLNECTLITDEESEFVLENTKYIIAK